MPEEYEKLKHIRFNTIEYSFSDQDSVETFDEMNPKVQSIVADVKEFQLDQAYMEEFLTFSVVEKAIQVFKKSDLTLVTRVSFEFHLIDSQFNSLGLTDFVVKEFPRLQDFTWSQPRLQNEHVIPILEKYSGQLVSLRIDKRVEDSTMGIDDSIIPFLLQCTRLETLEARGRFSKQGIDSIKQAIGQGVFRLLRFKYK